MRVGRVTATAVGRIAGSLVLAQFIVAFLFAPAPALAQSADPYELSTYREWGLSLTGAGLLLAGLAVQSNQQPLTLAEIEALDPNDVNAFDRPATGRWSTGADLASDVLVLTLIASPVTLAIAEAGSKNGLTLGLMYAETVLLNNGVTQLLKGATDRTRPFAYNDDPEIAEEKKQQTNTRRSFPSGHSANAFAAAVFLGTTYSKLHPESSARNWVWAGSLTAATAVGYFRYRAGKHFPTDIITGAVIGASFGYLIPKLHETGAVYVAPSEGGAALGAVLRF
jgi:membrane-associated phospholipid phosphatase